LLDGLSQEGVTQVWCNLCQWDKDEGAFCDAMVRNGNLGRVYHTLIIKKYIQVYEAGTIAESGSAPKRGFDIL
jgi:hypothetical protein